MQIEVLRLNHRIGRDPRISTHVALTARAFGASRIYYSGDKDGKMEETINKITNNFGGNFQIEHIKEDLNLVKDKKKKGFLVLHLTVYGLAIQHEIKNLQKHKKILVIIGGEKVEPEFYRFADYNLAITNQPHSEVAALAVFLHEYFHGEELEKPFSNSKLEIMPNKNSKIVKKHG